MTDFHHSLDRALDEEHPYAWAPPADTGFVDRFRISILEAGHLPKAPLVAKALSALGPDDEFMFYGSDAWRAYLRRDPVDPDKPVAYDGFGAPLYAHQIPAEGTE